MKALRILVTGTTGGIGSAVKAEAIARGHEVVEFNRADFPSLATSPTAIKPNLSALVFCTGTCSVKPLSQTTDELLAETLRVNCSLFLSLMRTLVTAKLYDPQGLKAIAISSVSATEGWPGGAAYCASKGALSAMCRALNAELKPKGISVVAIEPRYVKTRMFDQGAGRMGVPTAMAQDPQALAKEILDSLEGGNGR